MEKRYLSLFLLLVATVISACSDQQAVSAAPVIASFSANPGTLAVAESEVLLSWKVEGAPTDLSVAPNVGPVTGTGVRVAPTETTTYTLTASNQMGSSSAEVTVEVPLREPNVDDSDSNDHLFGKWQFEVIGEAGTAITGQLLLNAEAFYDQTPLVYGLVTDCESTSIPCAHIPVGGVAHKPGSNSYMFGLSDESPTLSFRAEDTDGKLVLDTQGRLILEGTGVLVEGEAATFKAYKLSK